MSSMTPPSMMPTLFCSTSGATVVIVVPLFPTDFFPDFFPDEPTVGASVFSVPTVGGSVV